MPIEITAKGYARLAEESMLADLPDTDWQREGVVPVSHADSAA